MILFGCFTSLFTHHCIWWLVTGVNTLIPYFMKKSAVYFKTDILSGLVVFLVALPLCLGIALASGAPLFAGIISGVIGGIVVGLLSHSQLSVSGPAAGLTAILVGAITSLGSYETFLAAVVLAGVFQILLGERSPIISPPM